MSVCVCTSVRVRAEGIGSIVATVSGHARTILREQCSVRGVLVFGVAASLPALLLPGFSSIFAMSTDSRLSYRAGTSGCFAYESYTHVWVEVHLVVTDVVFELATAGMANYAANVTSCVPFQRAPVATKPVGYFILKNSWGYVVHPSSSWRMLFGWWKCTAVHA